MLSWLALDHDDQAGPEKALLLMTMSYDPFDFYRFHVVGKFPFAVSDLLLL